MRGEGSVLVVSAEPALGAAICAAMQRLGIAEVLTDSAADAVHRLAEMAPAAIVIDLAFPEMEPEQIVHRALGCRETHGSPVLLLEAVAGGETDRESWIDQGCTAVLRRDSDPRDIAMAIHAALERKSS
jgi:DNA-binding response OmpR family regulator